MGFAEIYPLAAFAKIADVAWWRTTDLLGKLSETGEHPLITDVAAAREAANDADKADRERLLDHERLFLGCVRQHLEQLRADGRLSPTGGLRGRNVALASAWNDFVAGKPDNHETTWLLNAFATILTKQIVRCDDGRYKRSLQSDHIPGTHQAPTAAQVEQAWRKICAELDAGTSVDAFHGWSIECTDQKSGNRCELAFTDWKATLMCRNEKHELVIAHDLGPIPLSRATFDVPSGQLLLTDTLRIDGFDEGIDLGDREFAELCLNSAAGCAARTGAHAKEHSFGFCQTTNTTVAVFKHDTASTIAILDMHGHEEGILVDGWTKVGEISCDVWRITAIDKQIAAERIIAGGNNAGMAEVERYLSMGNQDIAPDDRFNYHEHVYAQNVTQLSVTPGQWTIHAGENFHRRMPKHRYGLPTGIKPWCILSGPAP